MPFKDGWFERAVLWLVAHLVDRPAVFAELARVLSPGGRIAIATFDPAHFDRYYLNRLFPSLEQIDRSRFPEPDDPRARASCRRFRAAAGRGSASRPRSGATEALERIRGRFISTLRLLDDEEFASGLARAEQELPERVGYELVWAVAVATRA